MKGFAVLTAVFGLLGAPIQAQAFDISEALRRDAEQKASPIDKFEREQDIQRVIQHIEAMKREVYETVQAQQNAARSASQNPVARYQTEQGIKKSLEIHNGRMMDLHQGLIDAMGGRH
jgi:pyridoxal biosynthesis lyase PdxS